MWSIEVKHTIAQYTPLWTGVRHCDRDEQFPVRPVRVYTLVRQQSPETLYGERHTPPGPHFFARKGRMYTIYSVGKNAPVIPPIFFLYHPFLLRPISWGGKRRPLSPAG